MKKEKLIIDADPGIDDTLAIWYVIGAQLYDVLGITTVAGNVSLELTTRNAQHIVNLVGADIPVWSGASTPLAENLRTGKVMGEHGLGDEQAPELVSLNGLAVEKIITVVRSNPHKISILAIGPLTNLAIAFNVAPDLPELIKEIVIMGGARDNANKNRVAEFNFYVDPQAAALVLHSAVKKTILPLDRCYETTIPIAKFEQLSHTSFFQSLMRMMGKYSELLKEDEAQEEIVIYDAVAAFVLMHPEHVTTEQFDLVVETKGEHTRGMLVFDKRSVKSTNMNAGFVTHVDKAAFEKDFLAALLQIDGLKQQE